MARVWDWLTGSINCQPLISMLTPTPPVDDRAQIKSMEEDIDVLEMQKKRLVEEMNSMRARRDSERKKGNTALADTLTRQLQQHMMRCKAIDERNMHIVGQLNAVMEMREKSEMVAMSARTTQILSRYAKSMSRTTRVAGGPEGVQDVMDDITLAVQEGAELVNFTSRQLLTPGMAQTVRTGVAGPAVPFEDELDAYLGHADEEESLPASAVVDAPVTVSDPYQVPVSV